MKPGNILCEIAGSDQAEGTASSVEPVLCLAGMPLEASEFERLLERAAEILSLESEWLRKAIH